MASKALANDKQEQKMSSPKTKEEIQMLIDQHYSTIYRVAAEKLELHLEAQKASMEIYRLKSKMKEQA